MNNNDKHIDYDLIGRLFSDEASEQDKITIRKWLSENSDNDAELKRIRKIWNHSEQLYVSDDVKVDIERAWMNISTRTGIDVSNDKDQTDTSRSPLFYISRIAATFLLGAIIYSLYFILQPRDTMIEFVAISEISDITLPDGSEISVNKTSQITYPEKFEKKERKVKLQGEAFFDVKHDEEKPFKVVANNVLITVLGTSFNIRAYEEENLVEVWVETGKVQVTNPKRTESLILTDGEKGIYNKDLDRLEKMVESEPNTLFWKTKTLIFRKTSLAKVFNTLERYYEVHIIVENQKILNCKLSGRFRNQTVEEILNNIANNFSLQYRIQKSTITLRGDGCEVP